MNSLLGAADKLPNVQRRLMYLWPLDCATDLLTDFFAVPKGLPAIPVLRGGLALERTESLVCKITGHVNWPQSVCL